VAVAVAAISSGGPAPPDLTQWQVADLWALLEQVGLALQSARKGRDEALQLLKQAVRALEATNEDRKARDEQVVDAVIAALAEAGLLRGRKHKRVVLYDQRGKIVGIEDA
jgi:hypothetical protein